MQRQNSLKQKSSILAATNGKSSFVEKMFERLLFPSVLPNFSTSVSLTSESAEKQNYQLSLEIQYFVNCSSHALLQTVNISTNQ